MKEYNVYIDESGDEGINRGSNYFILTAVIVDKEKDEIITNEVSKIKNKLMMSKNRQLHWNTIKSNRKKTIILSKISNLDITIINIVIDTREILFMTSKEIYNHFSGYLYERIGWFVRDRKALANIFVSSRNDALTKDNLIKFLKNHEEKFNIDYDRIKNIEIIPNQEKNLLQIADCCCSTLGQVLHHPDKKYKNYFKYLESKLYRYNGKYLSYGLKYVPTNIEYRKEFKELLVYLKKTK